MAQQLSQQDIDKIYAEISEIYGEEGAKKFNLSIYKAQLDGLIKEMNLQAKRKKNTFTGKFFTSYEISKDLATRNALAAKGYLMIFKLREFLTGETINYRYYFTDSNGDVKVRQFGEDRLLDIINFQGGGLTLSESRLKSMENEINSEQQKQKNLFERLMNKHFKKYTYPKLNDYMRHIGKDNLRIVRSAIMEQYGKQNKGLLTVRGEYQKFNEGHIYESLDTTLTYLFMHKDSLEVISFQDIDDFMFGSFLSRDNVKASKGADNQYSNTSIKSNNASLYSYNTISNQLVLIQQMLNSTNEEKIRNTIAYMFLDDTKTYAAVETDLSQAQEGAVQELLKWTQKNLTN